MNWIIPVAVMAQLTGATLDATTTLHCLARGGRELNPLLGPHPSTQRVLVTKSLGVAGVSLGMWYFHRTGHHKIAAFFGLTAGGVWGGAALHNAHRCNGWY